MVELLDPGGVVIEPVKQPKIPTETIRSDDCVVHIGQVIEDGQIVDDGAEIFPHRGEWVEILSIATIGEFISVAKLIGSADNPDAVGMGSHFDDLCHALAKRLIAWNWTDMMNDPMEQPHGRPDVLAQLAPEELVYLTGLTGSSQTPETRKNGSGPSGDTSSAVPMTQRPSRRRQS